MGREYKSHLIAILIILIGVITYLFFGLKGLFFSVLGISVFAALASAYVVLFCLIDKFLLYRDFENKKKEK